MNLEERLDEITRQLDRMEQLILRVMGSKGGSYTVPDSWNPNPIMDRQVRAKPGVDKEAELRAFRLHEFGSPKTDWDRAWRLWLERANPSRKPEDIRRQTVPASESMHPALVAERELRKGMRRFGQ